MISCVTTPSFSIRINGKAYGNIIPSRRLRQGDPLSLYLFLLCAEEFTSLLSKAKYERRIHGVQICRRAPSISNLLLQMILWFSTRQIRKKCSWFLIRCSCMLKLLDNALIWRSHQFILVEIYLKVKSNGLNKLWELRKWIGLILIWVYRLWLVEPSNKHLHI